MASIDSNSPPLIPAGTKSPVRMDSPSRLRSGRTMDSATSQLVAKDLEVLRDVVNRLHGTLQTTQSLSQLFIRNDAGEVIAAVGDLIFGGVHYTNYFSEIHVGDPNLTGDPAQSLFNANTDGTVTIGKNGQVFINDPFGNIGAWIGTQSEVAKSVTGAANNGSGAIRLQIATHGWATGDEVNVEDVGGVPNATGQWVITIADANHIDLIGSTFAGAYTSGGTAQRYFTGGLFSTIAVGGAQRVTNVADNGSGEARITIPSHGYSTGFAVVPTEIQGVSGINNHSWPITVIDTNNFDLDGSTFSGAYTGGGLCLNWPTAKLIARDDGSLTINDATITINSNGITTEIANGPVSGPGGTPASSLISIDNATGSLSYVDPFDFVLINSGAPRAVARVSNTSGAGTIGVYSSSGIALHDGFVEMEAGTAFTLTLYSGGAFGHHQGILDHTSLDFSQTSGSASAANYGQLGISITNGVTTVTADAGSVSAPTLAAGDHLSFAGLGSSPTAPGAGFAFMYYDTGVGALRYNLGGAGWVDITSGGTPGGGNMDVQFNNAGAFGGSGSLTWNGAVLTVSGGISATSVSGGSNVGVGVGGTFTAGANTGFTGTLAAAIAASKNVVGGIIVT